MLAGGAERVQPGGQDSVVGGLKVEELDAHADAGFDDANDDDGFKSLITAGEFHTGAGIQGKRLAAADEAAAQGEVRGDALGDFAGFEVDELDVGGKWKADSVTTVTDGERRTAGASTIGHGEDLAHVKNTLWWKEASRAAKATPSRNSLPDAREGANAGLGEGDERVTGASAKLAMSQFGRVISG